MSLTWKLILGFLFALVLQVAQMVIGGYFTQQMQSASQQVSAALSSSLAVQQGIDTVGLLRRRLAADGANGDLQTSTALYCVYLDGIDEQVRLLGSELADTGVPLGRLNESLAAARIQLREIEQLAAGDEEALSDAIGFFDDSLHEVEQDLSHTRIEVRSLAEAGVARELEMHDLPMQAGLAITIGGVVLMALFVAWFSRQLVIPIQRAWSELEARVDERTAELANTVAQLEQQIVERIRVERQKEDLHRQLVDASRLAGMAELANGVLHNVGNVLNSVNVSSNLLLDRVRKSKVDGLQRAVDLLRQHEGDLADFLTRSAQGSKLPRYLEQLAAHLLQERQGVETEAGDLARRIDHMKEIVARQQNYARVSGMTSVERPATIVDDVLRMHRLSLAELDIRVETEFAWDGECEIDRSRVLQILMNLVANAKHAVRDRGGGGGLVRISVAAVSGTRLQIRVADNGVGIAPENLAKVFAHGFTTKKDGHGFGLHHSANAATEMGGRLWVESAGLGAGATFLLELPLHTPSEVGAADGGAT